MNRRPSSAITIGTRLPRNDALLHSNCPGNVASGGHDTEPAPQLAVDPVARERFPPRDLVIDDRLDVLSVAVP